MVQRALIERTFEPVNSRIGNPSIPVHTILLFSKPMELQVMLGPR